MKILFNNKNDNSDGFTMIELIVVIIIIAILAITVVPKFFTANAYQEFTYQSEVLSTLRNIQTRAMQQTDGSQCHKVLVTLSGLGIPKNCDDSLSSGWQSDATSVVIENGHDVNFDVSSGNFSFTFDEFGRPSCNACQISIIGESTVKVVIESEGYIHAI